MVFMDYEAGNIKFKSGEHSGFLSGGTQFKFSRNIRNLDILRSPNLFYTHAVQKLPAGA
jgi:hypothetical protein